MANRADPPKALLFSVVDFLNDLISSGFGGSDAVEQIQIASECLSDVFAVDPADQAQRQSLVATQKLQDLWSKHAQSQATTSEQQQKPSFSNYAGQIAASNFFGDHAVGSAEYIRRFELAKTKFVVKYGELSGPDADFCAAQTKRQVSESERAQALQHKQRGNTLLQSGHYEGARAAYSEAIAQDPTDAVFFCNRAAAASHLGDFEAAVADAQNSASLRPSYHKAHSRLGLALVELGRLDEAVAAYEAAIAVAPESAQEHLQKQLNSAKAKPAPAGNNGGMPDLGALASMFGGGAGGQPDLAGLMQNPMMAQMAQQMMSNPDMLNNLMSSMGGGANNNSGAPAQTQAAPAALETPKFTMADMMSRPQEVFAVMESDPEVSELLKDPETAEIVDQIKTNPMSAMQHMGNPKAMALLSVLKTKFAA